LIQKKIAMLGFYAVGKTSLVRQFVDSIFDEKYHTTIGVKVDKKTLEVKGEQLLMMLWDIAGAEDHFSVPTSFVKGSAGYLLVVDGTRAETAERACDLVAQISEELGPMPFVVALNKADLADQWELDDEALAGLQALSAPVFKSSAKTGEGVEEAFRALAEQLV
jgi:small GTP-binding protein